MMIASNTRPLGLSLLAAALPTLANPALDPPTPATAAPDTVVTIDLSSAQLRLDTRSAAVSLRFAEGQQWPASGVPAMVLESTAQSAPPQTVVLEGDLLRARFPQGAEAEFRLTRGPGFAFFRLTKLTPQNGVTRLRLFQLPVPAGARIVGTLNAAALDGRVAAVLAGEPNVAVHSGRAGGAQADRAGCSHEFTQTDLAKEGRQAARFTARCDEQPGGWSMRGRSFPVPVDLTGCRAIRAWVHGDAQGEQLKIQLYDGAGGYRDNYVAVDFTGWRRVELTNCPINSLRYDRVAALNFYYNGIPASQSVTCLVDQVEAVLGGASGDRVVLLEDFEAADSPLWFEPVVHLSAETSSRHGLQPAAFGVVACPESEFLDVMERFEAAAGLPSPKPGGVWNKKSPWIKRSYFFLTNFRESQFEEALSIARRGGFHMILLGQESWCRSTGHYEVNNERFPDGLEGLRRAVRRFQDAGFRVGLHFLGPSIYPPDPYLTPVPDPRLVRGARARLGADVDAQADFLPLGTAPVEFPAEDGGYEGQGTVVQVGEELIWYGLRSTEAPFGFGQCRRGHLGTRAAPHRSGESVVHLVRSYGYHMFDMDTSLLDEVAANFAQVANACAIDMIYFDGSERLQGDHWYYNARLHKAFYDRLQNKNMLLQASSFSHYSWHLLARSASADGHGDLKGYLDERSAWFDSFARDGMPLDIGWYYGYDPNATPDLFEYVLGATIGYDSSMSFQVSPEAAAAHPFTSEILDLISRYEQLRLSGRVPETMKARLRINPALAGSKPPEERARLSDQRREYRLLERAGETCFQRVIYDGWHEVNTPAEQDRRWTVRVKQGPVRVGVQIQALPGPWLEAGPSYLAAGALLLESFDDLAPYASGPAGRTGIRVLESGRAGATLAGVTQRLEVSEQDARAGSRCALYTAQSTRPGPDGWSVIGKSFDPPLDLSWHKAIGFWLRGDGRGGSFKLQLHDGRGAADFYVANNFTGWRYQQLARPEQDPIDYGRVSQLLFYYNGLPGRTTVVCGIDDVKALPALDQPALVNPRVQVGDHQWAWNGRLSESQYLFFWPDEPITRYGLPLRQPHASPAKAASGVCPDGEYTVTFGIDGPLLLPARLRLTFQPVERHALP